MPTLRPLISIAYECVSPENAQQGARANTTGCHDPCCCTARASRPCGSPLTFGKNHRDAKLSEQRNEGHFAHGARAISRRCVGAITNVRDHSNLAASAKSWSAEFSRMKARSSSPSAGSRVRSPNKALQPTRMSVTPRAESRVAPAKRVADL